MFVLCSYSLLQLQMEIQCSPSQDSTTTEFSNALVPGKKSHLKQGGQIVRLISFSYGNSGYAISIFTNVCFACQEINIADHLG